MAKKKMYAAFERIRGQRFWRRVDPNIQGSKDSIIKTYQGWLIRGAASSDIERAIRPLKEAS